MERDLVKVKIFWLLLTRDFWTLCDIIWKQKVLYKLKEIKFSEIHLNLFIFHKRRISNGKANPSSVGVRD